MTNDNKAAASALPAEIELLLFNTAGITMAVDTYQIECIMSYKQAEQQGISFCRLNEIPGFADETSPASSTVILCNNGVEAYGLGVDRLDEIISVPIAAIQPMPEPLSNFAGPRLFWGIVPQGDDVILLIDLYRLKSLNPCTAVATA